MATVLHFAGKFYLPYLLIITQYFWAVSDITPYISYSIVHYINRLLPSECVMDALYGALKNV